MKRVAIVGGGISGLAAAHFLGRPGISCRLFEAQPRLGGTIRTVRLHECLVEAGPDSWLAEKTWMEDLLRDLGLQDQVIGSNDARRRTFIVRHGRLAPLPESMRLLAPTKPWQIASTRLLGPATKVRMALEWFRRPTERPDRSVAEFVRDHFGDEAVEYMAQPMLAGVYGAAPEQLSAEQVIPRFVDYERRYGSVLRGAYRTRKRTRPAPLFLTLRNGMGSLIEALERRVAATCEIVRARVCRLEPGANSWRLLWDGGDATVDHVIVATAAHEAGCLLGQVDAAVSGLLGGVPYTSSVVAALVYRRSGFGHPLNGFGFLVPRAEKGALAACTWVNTKFDGRTAPDMVLLRAFLAGAPAEAAMETSDSRILAAAHAELQAWMRFRCDPIGGQVHRWARAMPQYSVGHEGRMRELERRLRGLPGLHLAGNGFSGLGVPDCVRRSQGIADEILRG